MRPYTDDEIAAYVASGDPLDKAGAYAIQHPLFSPVAGWTGCYTSIMGLPLWLVTEMLAQVGISSARRGGRGVWWAEWRQVLRVGKLEAGSSKLKGIHAR